MSLIARWIVLIIGASGIVLYSVRAVCRYWDLLYNIFHLPNVNMYCM